MRTDKELLTLLRDCTEALIDGAGLCGVIFEMSRNDKTTYLERTRLRDILDTHAPQRRYSVYSWPKGEVQPRIDWLNSLLQRIEGGEQL